MKNVKKRRAFTLAEVLITLGIIGVVAALTLPTVISNYRKHEVETKLKKVYSLVNQAIKMTEAEYGNAENWFLDCLSKSCTYTERENWFKNYFGKYLRYTKIENDGSGGLFVYLTDGSILRIEDNVYDMGYFINQKAMKNNRKPGINCFSFRFQPKLLQGQNADHNKYTIKSTFEPYVYGWDGTREALIDNCRVGSHYCTKLIQYDGWKIPDDYPLKF